MRKRKPTASCSGGSISIKRCGNDPRRADAFFAALRSGLLGPTLSAQEVDGCNAILKAMEGAPLAWTAYALATAYHETASTMQPIKEYGGSTYFTRMYDVTGAAPRWRWPTATPVPATGRDIAGAATSS
jgi:putative chitinase